MASVTQDTLAANWSTYQFTEYWDEAAQAAYAYNPNTQKWLSYEEQQSLCAKARYINANNLGGVMAWDVSADRDATLLGLFETCLVQKSLFLPILFR